MVLCGCSKEIGVIQHIYDFMVALSTLMGVKVVTMEAMQSVPSLSRTLATSNIDLNLDPQCL